MCFGGILGFYADLRRELILGEFEIGLFRFCSRFHGGALRRGAYWCFWGNLWVLLPYGVVWGGLGSEWAREFVGSEVFEGCGGRST
jgi:hypothetical protein